MTDLTQLLLRLVDGGVEFVLVGGLAAVSQGAPVTTFDVDIVPRRSAENAERLLHVLGSLDARYRGRDDVLRPDLRAFMGSGHQLLATALGPLDVLGAIEDGLDFEGLLPNTVELELDGRVIRVLALEKLLELKRRWADPESRLRAAILEQVLKGHAR